MRTAMVLSLLIIPVLASWVGVQWLDASISYQPMRQSVNGTEIFVLVPKVIKLNGPFMGIYPEDPKPSLICFSSNRGINILATVKLDMAKGRDIKVNAFLVTPNNKTLCVPFTYNFIMTPTSGMGNEISNLKALWSFIKLLAGDISGAFGFFGFLAKPEMEGAFLDIYLRSRDNQTAFITHYMYQRKLDDELSCLKVYPETTPLVPDMAYNITFVNKCNSTLPIELSIDVKLASDIVLTRFVLDPGDVKKVRVVIPKNFGDRHYFLKFDEGYFRALKVNICEERCYAVYAIPIFDYMLFFVTLKDNYKVTWYANNREVTELSESGPMRVCFNLTKLHPKLKIDSHFTFRVVEDRRVWPDITVAVKRIHVRSFNDFNTCINFNAKTSFWIRGYKLVLDADAETTYNLGELYK